MEYEYNYNVESGGLAALMVIYFLVVIAIYVVAVIGLWKMYVKAGRPGWAAIIPVYNWWVWVEIIGRPRWWFWAFLAYIFLSWIPIVGIILGILMFVLFLMGCLDMAKCFGKGTGYGIGLWLLSFIFAPILGFGDAQYVGPATAGAGTYGGMGTPPPPPAGGADHADDPRGPGDSTRDPAGHAARRHCAGASAAAGRHAAGRDAARRATRGFSAASSAAAVAPGSIFTDPKAGAALQPRPSSRAQAGLHRRLAGADAGLIPQSRRATAQA